MNNRAPKDHGTSWLVTLIKFKYQTSTFLLQQITTLTVRYYRHQSQLTREEERLLDRWWWWVKFEILEMTAGCLCLLSNQFWWRLEYQHFSLQQDVRYQPGSHNHPRRHLRHCRYDHIASNVITCHHMSSHVSLNNCEGSGIIFTDTFFARKTNKL